MWYFILNVVFHKMKYHHAAVKKNKLYFNKMF